MGALRQLGALFWKNFLIRKRHPTFLVLEVLWPVVLFVALALMRLGFPPDHRETCEYQERAVPSAGLVPFLQSSICTLNNNCSTRAWNQQRAEAQQRFQTMIRDIDPLLTKESTIQAFKALPTVNVVLNAVKDVADGATVEEMDNKLVLRNMVRDPAAVVDILSDKYNILERRVAESLLDASINPLALVSSVGSVDFKGIVCDPDELEKYIILSDKSNRYVVNKYSVSNSLCRIEEDKISDITNDLIRQLDVANIIRLIQDLSNVTGSFDLAVLMEDMADLVDMFIDKSSLLSMMENMPDLSVISGAFTQLGKLVPMLNDLADMGWLESIEAAVRSASKGLADLDGELDLGLLNSFGLGLPQTMSDVPLKEASDILNMFVNGASWEDMSMNDTLQYIENMMPEMFGNKTANMVMAMATNMMEMMDEVRVHTKKMETDLKYTIQNTDAVTVSLNELEAAGPEMTYIFMAEMVTMENIYLLMSGESTSADICKDAVSVTYDGIPGYDTDVVVQTICSDGATAAIDQVFADNSMSSLTVQLEKEMADMDSIMKGTIPADQEIGNMKDMYYEMSDMLQELMGIVNDEDDDEWNLVLANTNIDYMGSYNWVFGMIGSQYRVQTKTMLPVVIVAKSAENGPMWESTFKPWFEMLDAMLHTALNRVHLFEEMNKEDKIITKVVKYLPYYPNIVQSAAGTNLSELARMLTSTDTTELTKMLCEKTDWNSLNVADDISINDMKMFVCQTNITKFVEEVWNIADPLSFLSDVELEVEHNLENGINWPRMVEDVQYLYQTLNGKNSVQDLLYTVFTSDLSMIYNYYTVAMELLTNMTMDSVTSDMENVSELETSLKSLDEALASWDLWKRVKHYIRTWNLLAKVLNHYAELTQDPNWDITEYVTTVSPTLGKYLQNSTDSMPEVIDALQKAAYKPQQMIERVMNIDYMGFCEDPESLSSLLGVKSTPSFTKFQNGLCELNWTQIMDELTTSATPWSDFASQWEMISTYDTESLPPISLNWTDVISTTRKFLDYINKGMFNNFVPDLSNAGLTGTNSSISNLTSALQNTWDYDADAIGKSVDQIWKLLFDMSAQNDTFIEMWQYNVAIQSYINYHLFKFVNIHLDIINRTKVFDLPAHLNSPRADKLFQVMVDSPELNAVILHNFQTAGGVEKWLTLNFDTLCTNTSQLEDAIQMPENSNITKTEIVDAICAAFGEEIIDEVRAGMEGLDDLINAMDNIISMNMTASELLVDYSKIAVVVERYSELLVSLSTADVQVKGLPFIMDGEITRLLEQFMDIPTQLADIYDTADPLKTLQDEQMLQGLMQLQDIPEVRDIMRISETYMRVLTAVLMKTEGMNLDPATGFQGYPEMYKMWQMLEWLPQLYVTFTYTSLVDNSKITTFTEAAIMGIDTICEADPYDLMTNPPILNIKFEDFFNLFCSVNFTLLEHEASDFIQAKEISEAYGNISSVSEKVDIDGWLAEYDRFMKQVEQFINKTGEFNIPGFDNMTVWEKIYDFLENTTNSLDTLTMASQNMDGLLEALVSMSPEFQNQLKSMEITNYVMGKMLDHLENMTGDSYKLEDFFHGFGQIQRLVMMLQEPGVMETLMASINTPKFTSLLENTNATAVLIDICDSDITKYMTIPPSVTANMNDVKDRFCDTDFEILMTEFVDAFFIQDILDMMETNTTLNWRLITERNSQLTEKLGKWLESPPNLDIPTRWENSTYWFQLLDLLNGEQAVETSDPTLDTLLKGMESFLGSQYSEIVKSISPLAIQIMQMIELDSDAKRTFATIDLFLDYMVDRLMDVSDNFTVGSLSKNSSEIVRFMEALANLRDISNTDYEALNKTVNQEKLYNLLLDPDMLMDMCEKDNVAAYISANGTASKASIALEEVICIDTETWSEILQDQVNLEMFEEKLAEIWNATNTNAHLNWTSLAGNVEKFVNMLSEWMERPPAESSPLSQWTDWEGILSFFDSLYKDPSVGSNILSNINPLFGSEMNNLTNAFNRLLMPFIKQLTSNDIEELYSNPEKLGSLIESILSVEDWLKVLSEFFNAYYSPDEDAPTRESILKSLVCGENEKVHEYMERYIYEMITGDPGYIWMLCNVDIAEWNNTLKSNSYTEWDLYQVQMMFNQAVEDKMSEHDDKVASKTVLEMLEKLNLDGLLNSSSTTEDWLQNSQDTGLEGLMYVLEMIAEEDILKDFKAMLLIIIEVQEYINTMLEKFTGNESVPITDILPSSSAMADFIENLASSDTVSLFTLAYVDPAKFITLMFSNDWEKTICNLDIFMDTFDFPSDINVTELQQHLCSEYASQKPYLDDIMSKLDAEKLIKNIENIIMNDTVNANNETWAYMSSLVDSIVRSLLDLENADITGVEDWFQPILKALENMGNTAETESYEEVCERTLQYTMSTEMYSMWVKPYMDSVHTFIMISNSVMNVQIGVDEAVCQMQMKNITDVIKYLDDRGLIRELKKIEEMMSQKTETEFSCASTSTYTGFFETLVKSLTKVFDGSSNIVECVTETLSDSEGLLQDLSKLFSAGSEALELLQNEDIRALLDSLMGTNGSTEFIDMIREIYNQQEAAVKQLQDSLEDDMSDITAFLQKTLSTSIDSVFSSLNMTFLENAKNLTADELIEKLCEASNTSSLDATLLATLCGDDKELAKEVAQNLANYAQTLEELEELAEYDSTAFWSKVSKDISALVGNIEGLSSLTNLVARLGTVDIAKLGEDRELLRTLQELLVDNGPDAILKNLNVLLDDFKILDDSNMTNSILDDVRMLAEGVFAFTSLRDMFVANVQIKDLVKDTEYLRNYMIDTMKLPENVTEAIIDGSLSLDALISAATTDIESYICNSTKLKETIDVKNGSSLDLDLVSRQFCSLDKATVTSLVDEIFQQLDIGQLMEDFVINGVNGILRRSNITLDATKEAIKSLVDANDDLQKITKTFNDFTDTIPDAFTTLAQAQTGDQEFGSLSAILCGNSIPMISDEFQTGAVLKSRTELTTEQQREFDALPGTACKDMYVRILKDRNGPIIWSYLKPLLRGKIVFSPNTPEARTIVTQINTTFSSLEEFIELAVDWAEGSVALGNLTGDKAKELQDLLSSNVIKSMLTEVSGVDTRELDDILYTLEDTDMDMMNGISKVAKMIKDYISCLELDRFEGFNTEVEMEKAAAELAKDNSLLAGIVFDMPDKSTRRKRQSGSSIPTHIHYTIRMDVDNTPDTDKIKPNMWRPQPYDNFFTEMRYFRGFAQLQDMIDEAIISLHVGENVTLPSVTTNQFPYPCHTQDLFVNTIAGYLLNVLMTLSWLAAISVAVYNFVYDRERGQEETLNAMGMKTCLNWIAWFFSTMFVMAIVAIIDVLILRYGNIFIKSNIAIIYLYFIDFIFSVIMMCYFVSAFFTRTSLAILACIIVYVVSYMPYVILFTLEVQMEFWHKTLACLASTSAFSYAAQYIARYEEQQIGIQWDNIQDDPMYGDGFSFSWCCIMILIDGVIYFILGWYVRNVKPGKFGVAEPWFFIFNPTMWCGQGSSKEGRYNAQNEGIFAEDVQSSTPIVLSARGLSKTYSDGTVAVKDLSLDIHCGNVTTLLGHNGAAKTTTMNMLIGVLSPSKGAVRILNQPLKRMRGSLGICSQHNALYEYMTVKEHMEFYSSMKGSSLHGLSAKDEIRQLLKDVDLYYCRNMLVKNLSGGMQRRLCVALAFVGGSKAVILDEPTSGVDPSGRRAVWNLIIRRKSDKTNGGTAILLSTHHLDEADVISDQIAIMHEGNLLCKGSPMFLKKNLASGHRLTIVKEESDTDPVPVLSMLRRWLPGTRLHASAGTEMTFVLPTDKEADFYGLFQDLEAQVQSLGIVSYGISDPHLEEVFLKVCSAADIGRKITPETLRHIEEEETNAANGNSKDEWKHDFESSASSGSRTNLANNSSRSGGGMFALLTKRFHHYRRDWRIVISTLILPLLLFLLASGLYKVKPDSTSAPSRLLSPAMYGPDMYTFMQQNSTRFTLGDEVLETFMVDPGIGTSCMADVNLGYPYKCVTPASKFSVPPHNASADGRCFCQDDEYKCEGSRYGAPPPQRVTTTTEILQNLNNRDLNKYLLDSFPEFIGKRYGGWSFEDESKEANANLKAKIWYNNKGYHALPSFFNAYSNGLLRALVNDESEAPKYGISAYNHPFMFGRERLSKTSILQHAADMGIAVIILVAFTFIPVGVLLYSVNENINKEKHMQFIGGISSFTYWMSSLIWDLLVLGVAVGFSVIILLIFKPGSFWDKQNLEATVCLLLLYGWATITFAYFLVKRFQNSGTAFFTVFCSLLFVGIFCILMVFSFNYFTSGSDNKRMKDAYDAMRYVFLVFPPYALGGGLLDLIDNQIKTVIYARFNTDVYENPFTFDMIGWHMFAMGVEGCIFFILTVWLDMRFCCKRTYECSVKESNSEDYDVTAERRRIDTGDCRSDAVVVRNLHKIYSESSKEVHAVNGLSFGVPSGQCFGLLGVNGAGKTSTFNVLTGVSNSSYGHCYILGHRIEPGSSTVGQNMGYCPQVDALDPYLSITNTLNFHASLKGIDGTARKQAIDKVMSKLDLHKIKNKLVKSCSGGMKRKLSLAVALLGDPAVVLLDEPTSGMDPKAKRLVWNCLLEAKKNGQAIILTSHSLEECDILCDRIGIMVNGEFKCLGTSQHLKQKYGDGYTVTLYVSGLSDTLSRINELIQKYFPRASVTDQHVNVVQLDIPRESLNIADMFGILEREKANLNILYYTVSQTTLDTIFLNFAREQTDGATVEMLDTNSTSSDRDSYNDSSVSGGQFTNPSYGYVKPTLTLTDDKGKGRSSVAYDNPYALPAKNTFNDDDDDEGSYSTRM